MAIPADENVGLRAHRPPKLFQISRRPDRYNMSDLEPSATGKGAMTGNEPMLPPEEGVRGWLCVLGAFMCLFCSFGFLAAIGVFQTTYQATILKDYSASDIAWIFAVQLALMWAPGPLFGRLIDTYGPGPVLYPSAILCVFALCMTSLADQYYQIFLAQGLAFGIGSGGVFTASFVCVGQWFVRRRGLAIGVSSTGSSLGGVVFPVFLDRLMASVGFAGALRYTALLIGVCLALSCFMVRARQPRRKWDPEAKWFDMTLFGQKQFAFYAVGSFFVMFGLWAPFDFISSMAANAGFSPNLAFYLISIINATSVPGRILPPHMGDRIGHFNVLTVCAFLTGASILALWLPFNYHPSHAGIIVFALVYGFVSGAVVSLLMPCVAKAGTLETLGQRFGTFQMVIAVSCLTGLPIMGAILNRQHDADYSGLQIFAGCSCLLGSGFLAASTYLLAKLRGTWKV
ncbi:Uu.00g068290.m01.CDS01 [Anthostomella pinea]|uniref:Uu.00g068290.m01.CDS01 n=1 Tax=Anthostomella pinea TaxID=933095 RepID=A0AAI8VV38_9PEZI|nr:Uu.00g068290.m01.CDS01 [Anthostomella pinea]